MRDISIGSVHTLMHDQHEKPRAQVLVITFFDYRGLVYTHTVPQGQTINGEY